MGRVFAIFVSLLLVTGCATGPSPIDAVDYTWSRSGLVNREVGSDTFSAELDVAGNADGALALRVSKTASLLSLTRSGDVWSASGPLAGVPWRGNRERAPLRLAGWITLAETIAYVQEAPETVSASVTGAGRARWSDRDLELVTSDTGERFRVVFSPQ